MLQCLGLGSHGHRVVKQVGSKLKQSLSACRCTENWNHSHPRMKNSKQGILHLPAQSIKETEGHALMNIKHPRTARYIIRSLCNLSTIVFRIVLPFNFPYCKSLLLFLVSSKHSIIPTSTVPSAVFKGILSPDRTPQSCLYQVLVAMSLY